MNKLSVILLSTSLSGLSSTPSSAQNLQDLVSADVARINTTPFNCEHPEHKQVCADRELKTIRKSASQALKKSLGTGDHFIDSETGYPSFGALGEGQRIIVNARGVKYRLTY